jgi:acetyl-CoA C-acetyltransferase
MDPNTTPVLIAGAQVTQKKGITVAQNLINEAAELCLEKAPKLREAIDYVCVPNILGKHSNSPASRLSHYLNIEPKTKVTTTVGGNTPQYVANLIAKEISKGNIRAGLIAGAEAMRSAKEFKKARSQDGEFKVNEPEYPDFSPDEVIGDQRPGISSEEVAAGLITPIHVYPLFESAMAYLNGLSMEQQRNKCARLFAPFSQVAKNNPYAWFPEAYSDRELAEPTDDNRIIAEPYTKRLCAFMGSDQGAAVIICSLKQAIEAGLKDQAVFLRAGADLNDTWFVSSRPRLDKSVALETLAKALFSNFSLEEIDFIDLYSCFPSAVQFAINALGLKDDDPRGFTITGGLPYFGGPGNNYTTHAIASMHEKLLEYGGTGLVTGLGWYSTKHSYGIYSNNASESGFFYPDLSKEQDQIDAEEIKVLGSVDDVVEAEIVASSVCYDNNQNVFMVPAICEFEKNSKRYRVVAGAIPEILNDMARKNLAGLKVKISGNPPVWSY